jgi:nucleoside-diphosphate-sugar epimerase
VTMRELATAIGRRLGLPVASKSPDEVAAHFGFYAAIVGADQPASCAYTRELLGWEPWEVGLLADFEASF